MSRNSHHGPGAPPIDTGGGAAPHEVLRPGDEVVVVEAVFVGRGSLRTLEVGDRALVRYVDDDACVVLSLGMHVHLPRRAIRLAPPVL